MTNATYDLGLYVTKGQSHWRVERPSGTTIVTGFPVKEQAELWLRDHGYRFVVATAKADHWTRRRAWSVSA